MHVLGFRESVISWKCAKQVCITCLVILHHAKDSVQQATVTGQEQYHSGTSHIYSINHLKTADGALQGQVLSKQILLHIATGITVTPNSGIYNFNTKKKKKMLKAHKVL